MSPSEFTAALAAIGWKQSDFARRLGLQPNSVSRWVLGVNPVPDWAAAHLALLVELRRLHAAFLDPLKPGALDGKVLREDRETQAGASGLP